MLSACREQYTPEINDDRKIVLECALQAGDDAQAKVHLTNSITDNSVSFFYPEAGDAVLKFIQLNSGDTIGRMDWDGANEVFTSLSTPIIEGETYEITVKVPEQGVDSIYALTTVPFAMPLDAVTVINKPIRQQVGNDVFFIDMLVEIEIPVPDDPSTYYELIPQVIDAELADTGVIEFVDLTKEEVKVLSTQKGIDQFIQKNGIFIDNSRLDDNTLELLLNFNVSALYDENLDSVRFTLNTVNRDYMVYHENTDREIKTLLLPLPEPQISANNILNGYGLFGAYSSSSVSVPIE